MSRKIGGGRGTSYLGTGADNPPNVTVEKRDPGIYDIQYELCDLWLNEVTWDLFSLVSLYGDGTVKGQVAYWSLIGTGSGDLTKLIIPSGPVLPIAGAINVVGDSNIGLSQPTPGTMQISYIGTPGAIYHTSNGDAAVNPADGQIKFIGGSNIYTYASATGVPPFTDIVDIALNDSITLSGSVKIGTTLTIDSFAATPGLMQVDNTGLVSTITPSIEDTVPTYNVATGITWKVIPGSGGAASSFVTDTGGPVVPLTNVLTVIGKNLIATDGATANTVKIGLTETADSGFVPMAQGAGFAPLWGEIVGGAGITVTPGSGILTITAGGGGISGGIVKITGNFASAALEDALNNINIIGAANEIEFNGDGVNTLNVTFSDTLVIPGTMTLGGSTFQHAGALITNATGVVTSSAGTVAGQVLTWSVSSTPVWQAPTGGSGASYLLADDAGHATVNLLGGITVAGGTNIGTTGGSNTLNLNLDDSITFPKTTTNALKGVIAIGAATTYSLVADRFIHSYYDGSSGGLNCYVGHGAGSLTSVGANGNTGIGEAVLKLIYSGDNNTCAGSACADALYSGGNNSLYGAGSGGKLYSYSYNCAFGVNSLGTAVGTTAISTFNSAFGYKSMYGALGDLMLNNSAYGAYSLQGTHSGADNCAFGFKSMYVATSSDQSSCFGSNSGLAISTGARNCLFGYNSGAAITVGADNVVVGANAFQSAINPNDNVIIGNYAGGGIVASGAQANVLVGRGALRSSNDVTPGGSSYNTIVGKDAAPLMLTASGVIALGYEAGVGLPGNITACASSIFLGAKGLSTDKDHSIFIGNHGTSFGQQDACYIAGINGATAAAAAKLVTIDSAHKLAPAPGTPGSYTAPVMTTDGSGNPGWGQITSTGDSITITKVGNAINLEQGSTYGFSAYLPMELLSVTGNNVSELIYVLGTTATGGTGILIEEFDDGNNFFPGSGAAPARYTAPVTGLYNFVVNIGYGYVLPAPPVTRSVDPIYVSVWNGATLYRKYILDYVLPSTTAGTYLLVGQQTVNVKLIAGYTVTFSFSAQIAATNIVNLKPSYPTTSHDMYTNVSGFLIGAL